MKRIRLKFFFIAAGSLLVVLLSIIIGLNVSNYISLENRNRQDIEQILSRQEPQQTPPGPIDPESEFKNRYFISTYINDTLVNIDMSHVAKVTLNEAREMTYTVKNSNQTSGYLSFYYFLQSKDENITQYVFLDRQNELDMFNKVLQTSAIIASIGYAVVLALVYVFSLLIIKPIEEANRKQKQFITDASHELKTPLTIISSNTDIIEMENGESEWTKSTKHQVDRLVKMTNELVMLSKLNEDKVVIDKTDINLSEILCIIVDPYINILKSRDVNLSTNIDSDCFIQGDAKLINNLFSTLMDNMNKYALKGDASISAVKGKNNIVITFTNECEPSSIGDPNRLFDRFYKVDSSRNSISNGFGVGLSMAKCIVELHKGKISASVKNTNISIKITF